MGDIRELSADTVALLQQIAEYASTCTDGYSADAAALRDRIRARLVAIDPVITAARALVEADDRVEWLKPAGRYADRIETARRRNDAINAVLTSTRAFVEADRA